MHINEIFWSVQGEGLRTGFPSIFVRLTGCTLQCSYCDTREAWTQGKKMDVNEVIFKIEKYRKVYPNSQVVITGGEPMEQDLSIMVRDLKEKKYFVSIETNGIYFQDLDLDWWTISPKDIGDFYIAADLFDKMSEVKLIVNEDLNTEVIKKIRDIRCDFPIFLQPNCLDQNKYRRTYELYQECQQRGIQNLRLGSQLHKIFKVK